MARPTEVTLTVEQARLTAEAVEFYLRSVKFSTGDPAEAEYRALLDHITAESPS